MTRDEIIRDLEERAVGEDCRYIALRCDVVREIVRMLKEQDVRIKCLLEAGKILSDALDEKEEDDD